MSILRYSLSPLSCSCALSDPGVTPSSHPSELGANSPSLCISLDYLVVTLIGRAALLLPSSAQQVQLLFILLQQTVILKSSSPFYVMAHVQTVPTNVVLPLNFWPDI